MYDTHNANCTHPVTQYFRLRTGNGAVRVKELCVCRHCWANVRGAGVLVPTAEVRQLDLAALHTLGVGQVYEGAAP